MNKLLKDPTYKSNTGYSGLDMSSEQHFTSTCGHIVPVTWDFLQPGDKIRVSDKIRTRTTPLVSAAFGEIEEHVRWFFVPMSQIYKPFGDLYHGIQDLPSDFYNTVIQSPTRYSTVLPSVNLGLLIDKLKTYIPVVTDAPKFFDACRLLEMIGVPIKRLLTGEFLNNTDTANYRSHSVNVLPLLAYQKIWYDYFRDTDRYPNNPKAYNWDTFSDSNEQTDSKKNDKLDYILNLRLCPMVKDTLNNLMVSPLFGESGIGGDSKSTLQQVQNWLSGVSSRVMNNGLTNDSVTPTNVGSNGSAVSALNTAAIRQNFAVEKLLEITRRARKHYDAQTLAHFGVDVPMGMDGECIEISHHQSQIVIGDIISTAATDDAPLGEIAGKGYNADEGSSSSFEAKTHGVLMCVYYARPKMVYDVTGIDKKLLYSYVYDFPREEFENLGMQPVFKLNQYIGTDQLTNTNIYGWQYRYQEVKSQFSRALTGMSRTLSSWNMMRVMLYQVFENFYCNPYMLNTILDTKYDDSYHYPLTDTTETRMMNENETMFDTDPLIHQLLLDYKKATKISTYGLSEL